MMFLGLANRIVSASEAVIFWEIPFLVEDKALAAGQFAQKSNATKTAAIAVPLTKQKTHSLFDVRGGANWIGPAVARYCGRACFHPCFKIDASLASVSA